VTTPIPERLKACCAAAYGSDIVALLLGDSYHPGGRALTHRLADGLGLRAGADVLDVAGGAGATAGCSPSNITCVSMASTSVRRSSIVPGG
jgi:hypothetical protein